MNPTTYQTGGTRRPTSRTWLAAGGALAALLVVLLLILATCQNARDDQADQRAEAAAGTPTPSLTATPSAESISGNGGEEPGQGGGSQGDNQGGSQGGNPQPEPDPESSGDQEEPAEPEPMSIETTVFDPPATPTCHATGKISIIGGDAQVTVTYRWVRLDLPPHHPIPHVPQVAQPQVMQEETLPIPPDSEITVTSPDFPEDDASNLVWLVVTIPDQTTSQQVLYDQCGELGMGPNG